MRESRSVRQHGEDGEELPETPALRQLRRLVTLLMGVLIVGTITVSAALVIRLGGVGIHGADGEPAADAAAGTAPDAVPPAPPVPALALPEGHAVTGLGRGGGELLVITRDPAGAETLRAFDAATGAPRSAAPVRRVPAGTAQETPPAIPEAGGAAPAVMSGGRDDPPGQ
jgi:hypothetical protein